MTRINADLFRSYVDIAKLKEIRVIRVIRAKKLNVNSLVVIFFKENLEKTCLLLLHV